MPTEPALPLGWPGCEYHGYSTRPTTSWNGVPKVAAPPERTGSITHAVPVPAQAMVLLWERGYKQCKEGINMELPIIGNLTMDYKSVGIGAVIGAVVVFVLLRK